MVDSNRKFAHLQYIFESDRLRAAKPCAAKKFIGRLGAEIRKTPGAPLAA
jgi:hypothetical protein